MPELPASTPASLTPPVLHSSLPFEQLVSAVEDYAIFTLDAQGRIRSWNLGAERMNQYQAEEVLGRHVSMFYTEEDQHQSVPQRELGAAVREGRFTDEGWRLRKDGTRFWVNITLTPIRGLEGQLDGFIKIARDLTERRKAAEYLRQSEERFRLLLENVEDYAIFMLDPEGHIMSWNAGAKRIKGYDPDEALGKHFSIFYPAEALGQKLPTRLLATALRHGKVEDEGWRVRKDGSHFWGQVLISAVRDSRGELRGFAKITRDLTDRRRIDALEELDRRKDTFLATLAHELRNPIAPLLTGLEMLRESGGDAEMVRSLATRLETQARQMSRLVDDMLDMSRIRLGKISLQEKSLPLSELLEGVSSTIQPKIDEYRHRFTITRPPQDLYVRVDAGRITQVLINLLANACKFTTEGGDIRLEAALVDVDGLKLEVSDNGRGISREWQERIFNLYDQVADGEGSGLGIGLALVKDLVDLHGGAVSVRSAGPGQGSTFSVSLPGVVEARPLPEPEEHPAEQGGDAPQAERKKRILIADDGRNAADILAMFFEREGLEPIVAYDGEQAVTSARSSRPDLILMDLGMPRLSGFDAARIIRAEMPGIPLVALSGWGAEEDRHRSAEAGFSEHMVKPVSPADLRALVQRFL